MSSTRPFRPGDVFCVHVRVPSGDLAVAAEAMYAHAAMDGIRITEPVKDREYQVGIDTVVYVLRAGVIGPVQ